LSVAGGVDLQAPLLTVDVEGLAVLQLGIAVAVIVKLIGMVDILGVDLVAA
jgi:hypothetical protein